MKPEFKRFQLEEQDGIAVFTMNRPEKMNAMDREGWDDVEAFVDYYETADHLRAAVITGAGQKAFIAGADIGMLLTRTPVDTLYGTTNNALNRMEECNKPFIAAINGYAFGGGLEIALACDLRILSENAVVGMPETGLGFLPAAGGTQRLTRLVGPSMAKDMILTGRRLSAQEALQCGVGSRVYPPEQLMAETMKIAKTLAERAPISLMLAKRTINGAFDMDTKRGIMMENLAASLLCGTEDMKEGTSAFLEKRKPTFRGR